MDTDLTPEQAANLLNPEWRINNLYSVVNKDQQAVTFTRNKRQKHFRANRHTRNLDLKSRQQGATTDGCMTMFDRMAFTPNFHALFVAHIKEEAQRIFQRKIRYAWDKFPLADYYKLIKCDAGTLEVGFGNSPDPQFDKAHSSIYVSNSGRSGTYGYIHVSEIAKLERVNSLKAKEFISGTIPALPMMCEIDIESTAEGDYGLWHDMYYAAIERWAWLEKNNVDPLPTDWKPHFYNWTWDTEEIAKTPRLIPFEEMHNAQYFKDLQKRHKFSDQLISYYYMKYLALNRDLETLQQEYPTTWQEAFVSSGGKFFPIEMLNYQMSRSGLKLGDWTFFVKYNPAHKYVFGVDPAGGAGGDNAVIIVLDCNTGEVVAEFVSDRTKPDELALEAVMYAKKYGNALIVPEINNHGLAFVNKAKDIYGNIYARTSHDKDLDIERKELGFNTNRATKPLILYGLSFALSEMSIFCYSDLLLKELRSYPKSELDEIPTIGKIRDGEGKHFDRVIALALAWEGRKHLATNILTTSYGNK